MKTLKKRIYYHGWSDYEIQLNKEYINDINEWINNNYVMDGCEKINLTEDDIIAVFTRENLENHPIINTSVIFSKNTGLECADLIIDDIVQDFLREDFWISEEVNSDSEIDELEVWVEKFD